LLKHLIDALFFRWEHVEVSFGCGRHGFDHIFKRVIVGAMQEVKDLNRHFGIRQEEWINIPLGQILADRGVVGEVTVVDKRFIHSDKWVRPSNLQSMLDEAQGMPAGGAEAAGVKSFGNLPLIVFTARLNTDILGWQAWQTELLQQSTNSQQLFAEKSGHNIEMEEPQAAVSAILQMVRQVRGQ
jgi:hypothetical protein